MRKSASFGWTMITVAVGLFFAVLTASAADDHSCAIQSGTGAILCGYMDPGNSLEQATPPTAVDGDNRGGQATPRELRVMTYNIKSGRSNAICTQPPPTPVAPGQPPISWPDCGLDLEGDAAVIRAYVPDIVALQEVDRFVARTDYQDQPAVLAAAIGFDHYCFAANLDHTAPDSQSNVPHHQYGTVIISRYPILDCSNTLLPRTGNNEQRGLTRALINVRGVPLQFYNTHLDHTGQDRPLQTPVIAAAIDVAPEGPKVLVGDLNAGPTALEMAPIRARLLDAWVEAAAPSAQNPYGFTYPARLTGDPFSRIDYVFVSRDVDVKTTQVPIDVQTRLASDHYPVVVEIALPGSAVGIGRKAAAAHVRVEYQ